MVHSCQVPSRSTIHAIQAPNHTIKLQMRDAEAEEASCHQRPQTSVRIGRMAAGRSRLCGFNAVVLEYVFRVLTNTDLALRPSRLTGSLQQPSPVGFCHALAQGVPTAEDPQP